MQSWLIRRLVQELLPPVIDAVTSRVRQRSPVTPTGGDPLQKLTEQSEARFAQLENDVRVLERRVGLALDELAASQRRSALREKILLGWSAVLTAIAAYLLLR